MHTASSRPRRARPCRCSPCRVQRLACPSRPSPRLSVAERIAELHPSLAYKWQPRTSHAPSRPFPSFPPFLTARKFRASSGSKTGRRSVTTPPPPRNTPELPSSPTPVKTTHLTAAPRLYFLHQLQMSMFWSDLKYSLLSRCR